MKANDMRSLSTALLVCLALAACKGQPPTSDAITGGNPQRGLAVIQRYGCGACHRIDGVPGAYGKVGPTLENIGERAYVAGTLWDAYEMGAPADIHCYTPTEFERKREQLPAVKLAAEQGLELLPEPTG